MVVNADARGHFTSAFKFNGRQVDGMIDTGATLVAINTSTARRIGISLNPSDFIHQVNTANGAIKAAVVTLDRLQIGRISVDNIQAVVLDDKALRTNLIGMSFLQKLQKYRGRKRRAAACPVGTTTPYPRGRIRRMTVFSAAGFEAPIV